MCGILGGNFLHNNFSHALKYIENRGPDFQEIKTINKNTFCHTRLSIIDLDNEANQPMVFDEILIVFNGEIYNYQELIKEHNLHCKTKSDTEVLIRLYQKYDKEFLNYLNGMFSFCIYDIKKDSFFVLGIGMGKNHFFTIMKIVSLFFLLLLDQF